MSVILAVDCGNSYLKWGIYSSNRWLIKDSIHNEHVDKLVEVWQNFTNITFVIASTVANQDVYNRLEQIFILFGFEPHWVKSQAHKCGLTNNYQNPPCLGSDRWAAMIAAWNFYQAPCLVVNIGTAMTVDPITDDGVFLGGYIFPGPFLLKKSLLDNTQIEAVNDPVYEIFPRSTSDAIHSGIIISLTACIEKVQRLFLELQGYPIRHCILSGGGVRIIKPHVEFQFTEIDNIVLEGLIIIAYDMLQENKV